MTSLNRILYLDLYNERMKNAPKGVEKFCDPNLPEEFRSRLTDWLRTLNCRNSCQSLQIKYSFSVPNEDALEAIVRLNQKVVSVGSGTAYWEHLLQARGCSIECYDKNNTYPEGMHFMPISTGGPEKLLDRKNIALFLSWPDSEEESSFSTDCLSKFQGDVVVHVGELVGSTQSANMWGQSTSRAFQLMLFERFRRVKEVKLPNWPGHMDSLTIWRRASPPVRCDGSLFQYLAFE